jgi:uncharacterized membrane protein YcaP (DUF421 family)
VAQFLIPSYLAAEADFMNIIDVVFGEGKDLNALQMSVRAVVAFFLAWLLLRISGRRSFGLGTPLDNVIAILLGAILSRGIVGASPFLPVVMACFAIVLLHRLMTWVTAKNERLGQFMEGKKILLFENGKFIPGNMKKALVSIEHVIEGLRKSEKTEQLANIEKIYMERNGEISFVKKS